jgi:hypothetical protein
MERRRRRGHGSGVVMATGVALVSFWVLSGGSGAGAVEEPPPTVTIAAAADGTFSEITGCDQGSASIGRGELVVTRTGPTDLPLVVRYSVSSPDESDFEPLPGTITIPEGEASATIGVTPRFADRPPPVNVHRTGEVTITLTDTAATTSRATRPQSGSDSTWTSTSAPRRPRARR